MGGHWLTPVEALKDPRVQCLLFLYNNVDAFQETGSKCITP